MAIIPDGCIQCELVLNGRLRNPVFVAAMKEQKELAGKDFKSVLADYLMNYHHYRHLNKEI